MRTLATMLLVVLLALAGPCAAAADQPAGQPQEKKKAQQAKDKPQGEQGGAKRKRSVPET